MRYPVVRKVCFAPIVLISIFLILFPVVSQGGTGKVRLDTTETEKLTLTVGKSVIVGTNEPVKRVSLGSQEIADAIVLTPQQISVIGKAPGVTNLTLWGLDDRVSAILDIQVSPDVSRLREMIQKLFPEEKNLHIDATHDNLTLSGTVSGPSALSQILALAEPFFPKKLVNLVKVNTSSDAGSGSEISRLKEAQLKEMIHKILPEEKDVRVTTAENTIVISGMATSTSTLSKVVALAEAHLAKDGKIVNLLEVGGVHQVMLEVRVAEMSRSLVRRLGFNFNYFSSSGKNLGLSLLNNLTKLPDNNLPSFVPPSLFTTPTPMGVTDSINYIFRFLSHDTSWTVFIDALKESGMLKILAEPTLITLSGKQANFLAGGEFPVPVPQPGSGGTAITIQYKPFGVGLNFTPTVLSSKKIGMEVAPEVSELDFSNAITVSGFVVPSVTTRRVSTVIELADGQSFAIAGLLKDDVREIVSKFPILGEVPILGALFRSSSFRKNETELIVIVTPHLVKPLDVTRQTLPTDQFIEPDDFEFYLLGRLEGREKPNPLPDEPQSESPELEGNFGHILPK